MFTFTSGEKYLYKQMIPKAAMEKASNLTKTNWHFQTITLKKIEFSDPIVSVWTTSSLSNILNHSDWTLVKFYILINDNYETTGLEPKNIFILEIHYNLQPFFCWFY